jgi:LysR family transcriptional regulator, hydrogen peroxide-inducible genes activator
MNRMDGLEALLIRDLRAVLILAERKHFAQAAEEFGISQPALSAIVKKVEAVFGATLFERTSRRFAITPEGEAVVRQIRTVMEAVQRLATLPESRLTPLFGPFRLGAIPTLGPYYLPCFLEALNQAFPSLELMLIEAKTETLLHHLRQRELDAALLALPTEAGDMEEQPLFRETFVLAVPEEHALANRPQVRVSDINLRELLVLEQGNCLRDQSLDACGAKHTGEKRTIHATSLETLRYMVATRIGIALLPRLAVSESQDSRLPIRYLPFASPEPGRVIGLVTRQYGARERDVDALTAFLRAHLPPDVERL